MLKSFKERKQDHKKESRPTFQLPKIKQLLIVNWGRWIKGFICCYVVGVGSLILGVYVSSLPYYGTDVFIGLYAFGNLFALCSTFFLVGPVKQLRRMCDKSRVLATLTMLACVGLTPYAAIWLNNFSLTVLFCALHLLSFSWYSLSFTPCVRKIIKMFSVMKIK